jgi:F0F1-type ATP synthase delta subunit
MKIKPEQYAKRLAESAKSSNEEEIAKKFWLLLQKNKQYKDLPKILELLDIESAKAEDKVLVRIYSSQSLSKEDLKTLSDKIEKMIEKKPLIQFSCKPNITGIVAKYDGKIIDLSVEEKVSKLRRLLRENK